MHLKVKAKEHPVFFMCLGADVEFIIFNLGQSREQRNKERDLENKKRRQQMNLPQNSEDGQNPITEAGVGIEIWPDADASPKTGKTKASKDEDLLKVKLTHGSILMFNGADVEVRPLKNLSMLEFADRRLS